MKMNNEIATKENLPGEKPSTFSNKPFVLTGEVFIKQFLIFLCCQYI